jgi:hypothetical protein
MEFDKIEARLSYYLEEYFRLRVLHTKLTAESRMDFPHCDEILLALGRDRKFWRMLNASVEFLDRYYPSFNEKDRVKAMHYIFVELDQYLVKSSEQRGVQLVSHNQKVFFKTSKYWKKIQLKPSPSFSRPFQTFGLFEQGYPAKIIYLEDLDRIIDQNRDFYVNRDHLTIGLFPLSDNFKVKFRFTENFDGQLNTRYFLSDHVFYQEYKNELDGIFGEIRDSKIDIACFPELLIDDNCLDYLKQGIVKMDKEFFILIGGSFHRLRGEYYKNNLPVLIYLKGEWVSLEYSKYEPYNSFLSEEKIQSGDHFFLDIPENGKDGFFVEEDIQPDTSVLILCSHKFGDIGFIICKDFITSDNKLVSNYTKITDHLMVVSLNSSEAADFANRASNIAREHRIATFYVNARSFDRENKSPSFWVVPAVKGCTLTALTSGQSHITYVLPEKMS